MSSSFICDWICASLVSDDLKAKHTYINGELEEGRELVSFTSTELMKRG